MNEYGTLSQLRTFISLASQDISDDTELKRFLINASRRIDQHCKRKFYPQRKTGTSVLKFDLPRDDQLLDMRDYDLLDVKGLSDLNGTTEIDSGAYLLKTGDRWNITPYDRVVMKYDSGSTFSYSGTPQQAVHVDAILGYHENYNDAWLDSGGSLTDALGSTTTMASVSASQAYNSEGIAPRFSQGQIWKLTSGSNEEFCYVQSTVNSSAVQLIRGINGTVAADHAASTQVYVWQTEPDIEDSAVEVAAFMYSKAKSPFTNRISVLQLGVVEQPDAWPEQSLDRLSHYKKRPIHSF